VNLCINPITAGPDPAGSSASGKPTSSPIRLAAVTCPHCSLEIPADSAWESCPYCQKSLQIRIWPIVRESSSAVPVLSDHATCFFHPDKPFQACCRRCGRFVCALCDLQLGADHVCPTCFERERADSGGQANKTELRYRDVLWDSIAVTMGWGWILFWPTFVVAIPAVIYLHAKYRNAPRSYLIPRSGWRFWMAYVGFVWLPLLFAVPFLARWMARRH
jgi:hypothetical protein